MMPLACLEAKEAGNKITISGVFYNFKQKNVNPFG